MIMSIATEISRIQQAKADIKTAIEAKGVSVPSSATIDTYDDYVSQITGGLSRVTSGTAYCTGHDLYVDVTTDISIDGGTSWVESGVTTVLVESGSSQCTRLPSGYTKVEYIENTGTSYINTNFTPNQDTRIVAEMQVVTYNTYGRLLGAGNHNTANTISCDYVENGDIFEISWGGYTGWTQYSMTSNYDKHKYDWNKNSFYIDGTLLDSKTYTAFTCSYKLGIFNVLESGNVPTSNTGRYFYGKLYSFKIYDNDTLVRDFVPAKRDNDSVYGLYDLITREFYSSPNGNSFSGGSPV